MGEFDFITYNIFHSVVENTPNGQKYEKKNIYTNIEFFNSLNTVILSVDMSVQRNTIPTEEEEQSSRQQKTTETTHR